MQWWRDRCEQGWRSAEGRWLIMSPLMSQRQINKPSVSLFHEASARLYPEMWHHSRVNTPSYILPALISAVYVRLTWLTAVAGKVMHIAVSHTATDPQSHVSLVVRSEIFQNKLFVSVLTSSFFFFYSKHFSSCAQTELESRFVYRIKHTWAAGPHSWIIPLGEVGWLTQCLNQSAGAMSKSQELFDKGKMSCALLAVGLSQCHDINKNLNSFSTINWICKMVVQN